MAGYIYNLMQVTASGKVELLNASTKKYVITDFIKREFLDTGWSIDSLSILRAQDGRPGTVTQVDPYEFMQIDLGEQ